MLEPVFNAGNKFVLPDSANPSPEEMKQARLKALLWRATEMSIEAAFRFGADFPVGATAAAGNTIVGRYYASDRRTTFKPLHAEVMAVLDAQVSKMNAYSRMPDTVVVTIEPCDDCQDYLAQFSTIKQVGFGLPRKAVSDKGLIKPHDETIFERAERVGLGYEVIQIDYPVANTISGIVLDHTQRNPNAEGDEKVEIDTQGLEAALLEFAKS